MKSTNLKKFEEGTIEIVLPRDQFFNREKITGFIRLNLSKHFSSRNLILQFIGASSEYEVPSEEREKLKMNAKKLRDCKVKSVFLFTQNDIQSKDLNFFLTGEHIIHFEIQMSSSLKSSLVHSCTKKNRNIGASIKYQLKAFLKDSEFVLETKNNVRIYSATYQPVLTMSKSEIFQLSGFKSIFVTKKTKLELLTKVDAFDMEKDNQVFINIDTTMSNSSPLNIKLCIITYIVIKLRKKPRFCRYVIWEKLITSKLTKGTDYSNENGLTASIPSTAFGRSFQSMKTDKILNQFCFRLSYDENKNGEDRNYIFLPFQTYRASLPSKEIEPNCIADIGLTKEELNELDKLFISKKELMEFAAVENQSNITMDFIVPESDKEVGNFTNSKSYPSNAPRTYLSNNQTLNMQKNEFHSESTESILIDEQTKLKF